MLNDDVLFFFNEKPMALPLYEAFAQRLMGEIGDVRVKVQKTQISFANRYNFAFVSLLPVRRAKDRPETYITVSFGLGYRKESPRIDAASEPYPRRWTHHVLLSSVKEYFKREFDGCTLTKIGYVGDTFADEFAKRAQQYKADEAIILYSSFTVDSSGGDGSLNPNSSYDNWQWILVRDANGAWRHADHGYG